jgi:hypothetical protein
MKFMARILAIVLMIAMMVSVVGCGNTTQNGGNNNGANVDDKNTIVDNENSNVGGNGNDNIANEDANDNSDDGENEVNGPIDIPYTPNPEGLIGIAVYPVSNFADYTYQNGEIAPSFYNWKYIYIHVDYFGAGQNYIEFDDNIIGRDVNCVDGINTLTGTYVSSNDAYLGYVYVDDMGEHFIVATNDLVNFDDGVGVNTIETPSFKITLIAKKVSETLPNAYKLQYVYSDVEDGVETEYKREDIILYRDRENKLELTKTDDWNTIKIVYYVDDNEVGTGCDVDYESEICSVGLYAWFVDGYLNGESYSYTVYITKK